MIPDGTATREADRGPEGVLQSAEAWLKHFEESHQRPFRVLHIGNIANNAYVNAKIQRQRGIEADVACYDYYHIMGCPEWEDADFRGEVGDQFFPDWWATDLQGFERPRWFAQGRLRSCQKYLLAWREGDERTAERLWYALRFDLWVRCRHTRFAALVRESIGIARMAPPPAQPREGFGHGVDRVRSGLWRARAAGIPRVRRGVSVVRSAIVILGRKAVVTVRAGQALAQGKPWREAALSVAPRKLAFIAATPIEHEIVAAARTRAEGRDTKQILLAERWKMLFPDREPLQFDDYRTYIPTIAAWKRLFAHYDVIQGYATDPIIPLLAESPAFCAYEHGTLREIPFEQTSRGRICSLGYRTAGAVFVTNSDCLPSTDRLGIDPLRVVPLPHAVDSNRLLAFADEHASLAPSDGDRTLFFSPSRHDWVDGDPSYAKGNDRLLEATRQLLDESHECRLLLVEWGRDLNASRELVSRLGLNDVVSWCSPLRKKELWRAYLASHAIVDQFVVPAIGSVTFESLGIGRRVITSIDTDVTRRFFGEAPPVLNSSTVEEIVTAMRVVVQDPQDAARRGMLARKWFERFHSADRIVELQVQAYAKILRDIDEAAAS